MWCDSVLYVGNRSVHCTCSQRRAHCVYIYNFAKVEVLFDQFLLRVISAFDMATTPAEPEGFDKTAPIVVPWLKTWTGKEWFGFAFEDCVI